MVPLWHPIRFLLVAVAGWINQQQREVIDYLQEENRVLREQLGPRIQGALANLNHHVSRGTIANILRQRDRASSGAAEANDLAGVPAYASKRAGGRGLLLGRSLDRWRADALRRPVVIDLATRRLEIAGIVPEPDSAWVIQCGRQITDPVDGCLRGKRFLLHDRDPRLSDAFGDTLAAAGIKTVRLPPRSPNLNASAERFVRTIKESCLDRLILVGRTLIALCNPRVRRALPSTIKVWAINCCSRPPGRLMTTARPRVVHGWADS